MDELPQPHPQVVSRRLEGCWVLVHLDSGTIFELNETAGALWALLPEARSRDELVARLLERYDVPRAEVEDSVEATLRRLSQDNFVISGR